MALIGVSWDQIKLFWENVDEEKFAHLSKGIGFG